MRTREPRTARAPRAPLAGHGPRSPLRKLKGTLPWIRLADLCTGRRLCKVRKQNNPRENEVCVLRFEEWEVGTGVTRVAFLTGEQKSVGAVHTEGTVEWVLLAD